MKLTEKIKNIFLYIGMDKATYKKIESRLQLENRKILLLMSVVTFFILSSMTVLNSVTDFLNTSSAFYAIGAAVEAVIFVLCLTAVKRSPKIIPYMVEINIIIIYALSIGIATIGSLPSEPTVTFFVFLILLPLLFIGRPITFAITNVVATVVFILMNRFKSSAIFERDLTNAIVYVLLGTSVSTWLVQSRARNQKLLYDLEQAHQEVSESFGIVEGLSQEYHTLWLVNKDTLKMRLIRSSGVSTIQNAVQMGRDYPDFDTGFAKYINTYVEPEDRERVAKAIHSSEVLRQIENPGIYTVNYLRRTDDGKVGYHQIAFANASSEGGEPAFVYGFRDVDAAVREEQKKQQLLQDALDAAEYANQAKTTFLNNMSHDIRTPMNAIVGFTALAASHIDNTEQVQDYLKKITSSSQHLLSLINDVLDMSRIESGKMKIDETTVHLPDVLHDLRTIIQVSIANKQLNLFIDTVDVTTEDVICDPMRLNQVLINLVSNAIKFTQPGGYISIRLVQKPGSNPKYADYEFHIKDNGIGMSPEFAEHVFDSFAREENSTVSKIQGTGLGMAITKNIVDMMGGTIEVESEKDKGTEFIVNLSFRVAGESVRTNAIPELKGIRALVVDDDSSCCVSVSEMLEKIGLRADWTLTGHEAILRTEVAVKQNDSYGVFVIDLVMPDMNGIETVRRIRRVIGDDTPIIILTAYDWSDVEKEALDAGVTAFCSKPIFMSELQNILSKPFRKQSESKEISTEAVDFRGHKILLAEDNELNQEIAVALLSDFGISADVAEDGHVAVQKMQDAAPGQYELILMDIQMPTMDGYEATKQIRAMDDPEKANIPIIAMTANAFTEDRRLAIEAGMNDHIAKPIDIDALTAVLAKYLK